MYFSVVYIILLLNFVFQCSLTFFILFYILGIYIPFLGSILVTSLNVGLLFVVAFVFLFILFIGFGRSFLFLCFLKEVFRLFSLGEPCASGGRQPLCTACLLAMHWVEVWCGVTAGYPQLSLPQKEWLLGFVYVVCLCELTFKLVNKWFDDWSLGHSGFYWASLKLLTQPLPIIILSYISLAIAQFFVFCFVLLGLSDFLVGLVCFFALLGS